jgi:HEAT repeat protein
MLVLFVLAILWPPAAPHYQGKSLNQWLGLYYSSITSGTPAPQAKQAIRQIGTNALPTLIRMIQAQDSFFKSKLMDLASKQHFLKLNLTPASTLRFQATMSYQILGAAAKAQVPELTIILTNDNTAQVRQCAATALGFIGEEAKPAAAALLVTAKDQDNQARNSSLWALSRIHADPALVLPGLIEGLNDSFHTARENAAWALAQYGTLATSAVPTLIRTTNINPAAYAAILTIDPAAVSSTNGK